ncbi:MAG: aldehyde dehydrogenase family protein [Alphaproteobacteria bacterium]
MKKRYGSLINGSWVKHKKTFDVRNPFDNSKILEVYDAEETGTLEAIKSSANAFKEWKKNFCRGKKLFFKNISFFSSEE